MIVIIATTDSSESTEKLSTRQYYKNNHQLTRHIKSFIKILFTMQNLKLFYKILKKLGYCNK